MAESRPSVKCSDASDGNDRRHILDLRPANEFIRLHRTGAVNIPLEELLERVHELPRPWEPLLVFDTNQVRARWARSRLRARGRTEVTVASGEGWLHAGPVESGSSRGALWRSHDLLVEAVDEARRSMGSLAGRRALDIACGCGRDAVFLAQSGFDTEAWDILPDALARCSDLSRRCGVQVTTRCHDVERSPVIPPGRFDLICVFNFLHRPLMPVIADALRPGGYLVCETFVAPQRETFGKPRRQALELAPGELPGWFKRWRIAIHREGLAGPRRIAASLIVQKPES